MALNIKDILDDPAGHPAVTFGLVAIGVIILVRLKLVLFAAALPVMAYWHYTNMQKDREGGSDGGEEQDDDDNRQGGYRQEDEDYGNDQSPSDRGHSNGRRNDDDDDLWDDLGGQSGRTPLGGGGLTQRRPARNNDDDDFGGDFDFGGKDDIDFGKPAQNIDDDFGFGKLGGSGLGSGDLDDILGAMGGLGDDDFMGRPKGGKGKKGGGKDKGDKGGDKGPREPNPKQVFVAGIGEATEDDLRDFFAEVGEIDRVKLLRNETGGAKGCGFVTFTTEQDAQQALSLHGSQLDGRNITVRLAHGGNAPGKGDGKDKNRDRGFGRDAPDRPPDLGGADRFGAAFADSRNRDRDRDDKGGSKGKGKGGKRTSRNEIDELLEEALEGADGPVRPHDFDFSAKRFLGELRTRDRSDGTDRFNDALQMVFKYTSSKDRSSVRKWPAYIFTLLQKFDPELWDELRERDAERRREKGGGGFGGKGGRDFDDGD